jgi:glycosyltransferase involved in cell wall biosynthesis
LKRLVFITQRVDAADPILAATVPKIVALAERVNEVVVLAQSGTGEGLPENVLLRTFGAPARIGRGFRFERALQRALPADAVVAHMVPLYVVLAAPLVRTRGIPLVLWYTHWRKSVLLRVAEGLATAVTSVDRRSFPFESSKVHAIGHGIDVREFPCASHSGNERLHALVLGRYSPAKGLPTIFEAAREAGNVELELHGVALNDLERAHKRELERFGFELGDPVPRSELPALFSQADVLVNNMRAGAPDKVVYEAAASCLPVLASNPVFDELFEGFPLAFDRDDPKSLADRLRWLSQRTSEERAQIGRALRRRVAERHSVETWADGIIQAAT